MARDTWCNRWRRLRPSEHADGATERTDHHARRENDEMKYHDAANLFPMMDNETFDALRVDIAEHGLREPIVLFDGEILDGRNRHRACDDLGIEPDFTRYAGDSPVAYVVSLNLHRRHLDTGQRSMIGLKMKPMLEAEIAAALPEKGLAAAKKQWYGPEATEEGFVQMDRTLPEKPRDARSEIAETMNVSTGTMARAKVVADANPGLADAVLAGDMKLNAAYRQVIHEVKRVAPPLPDNVYRVWYADPPWSYGNSGPIGEDDNYGRAERHYPTMSIAELCDMGDAVKERCAPDAVLFLWVPSPFFVECSDVITAWGFKYKTSFVWDKVGHNYGHYNSVRHEFLLICTRGSCTPDEKKLFDSVQVIEKTRTHSEKPERFREIIDEIYPDGNRIELFARVDADGWDKWGNE